MRRRGLALIVLVLALLLLLLAFPRRETVDAPVLQGGSPLPALPVPVPPPLPAPLDPAGPPDAPAHPVPSPAAFGAYIVFGPDQRPVKGARLWAEGVGALGETFLGETDGEGILAAPEATGPRVVARAPGLAPFRGDPADLPIVDGRRVVRLAGAGTFRGRFVDREGHPLAVTGTVALWRADDEHTVETRQSFSPSVESALVATVESDATGQFSFTEMVAETGYRIVGGAPGFIFAGAREGILVRSSDAEAAIPLDPLYAAVFRLHDSDGGPMEINFENNGGVSFGVGDVEKAGYILVNSWSASGRLATRGMANSGPTENGDYIVTWTFRRSSGTAGPLRFHFKAAAYEHVQREVTPNADPAGVQELLVPMPRIAPRAPKGVVLIRFDTSHLSEEVRDALSRGSSFSLGYPQLHFIPVATAGSGRRREVQVPLPLPAEFVARDVEVGTYKVRLLGCNRFVPGVSDPETVEVTGGGEAACFLALSGVQCLALDVKDGEGRAFTGALNVQISSGPVTQTGHGPARSYESISFFDAPYLLLLVEEGSVDLRISASGFAESMVTATVAPGAVTRCPVRMDKK